MIDRSISCRSCIPNIWTRCSNFALQRTWATDICACTFLQIIYGLYGQYRIHMRKPAKRYNLHIKIRLLGYVKSLICITLGRAIVEVRDSRTGYFIPARYGIGLKPNWRILGASPSSGKWPNLTKCKLFQNGHVSKFQKYKLSMNKSPAGSFIT